MLHFFSVTLYVSITSHVGVRNVLHSHGTKCKVSFYSKFTFVKVPEGCKAASNRLEIIGRRQLSHQSVRIPVCAGFLRPGYLLLKGQVAHLWAQKKIQ